MHNPKLFQFTPGKLDFFRAFGAKIIVYIISVYPQKIDFFRAFGAKITSQFISVTPRKTEIYPMYFSLGHGKLKVTFA